MNVQRVDLGGGLVPAPGHLNIDSMSGADIVWDLNKGLPKDQIGKLWLGNNVLGFDGVRCHQVLEHLDTIIPLMNDTYAAMNPGALFEISTPYALSEQCWTDPTHKRGFTKTSFEYFIINSPFTKEQDEYGIIARFEMVSCEILDGWNVNVVFKKPEVTK